MDEHLRLDGPLLEFAPVQIYVLDLVRLFPIQEDDVVSNARDDLGLKLNVTVNRPGFRRDSSALIYAASVASPC